MDYSQILPELFVGSHPAHCRDIDRLQREVGITAVLNLQTSHDYDFLNLDWPALLAHYRLCGIEVRRVPIRDFDAEDLRLHLPDAVATLDRLLSEDHTVFVHCTAGTGRSPSVVIAYLHWLRGCSWDKAIHQVQNRRTCSPDLGAIRQAGRDRGLTA